MKKFLDENEINEDILQKILQECSKFNSRLKSFLEKDSWHQVPAFFLRKFIELYEQSEVNLRTGEIIRAHSDIEKIEVKKYDEIQVEIKALLKDPAKGIYNIFLISEKAGGGKEVYQHGNLPEGITLSFTKGLYGTYFSTLTINNNRLVHGYENKYTVYILEYNHLKKKDTENFDSLWAKVKYDDMAVDAFNITDTLNKSHGIIAFEIFWDVNSWNIRPVMKEEKRNFFEIVYD